MPRSRQKSDAPTQPEPKKLEIEINADEFSCADYELLTNWSTGVGNTPIGEIFDVLDRVIVGGFRQRRFVDVKLIIQQMLTQLSEIANGQPKN